MMVENGGRAWPRAQIWPATLRNRILLGQSYAHLFRNCLLLLLCYNSKTEQRQQRLYLAKLKMFTIWPLTKKFAMPWLKLQVLESQEELRFNPGSAIYELNDFGQVALLLVEIRLFQGTAGKAIQGPMHGRLQGGEMVYSCGRRPLGSLCLSHHGKSGPEMDSMSRDPVPY